MNNLEDSIKFWCDTMGFKIHRRMEEKGKHIDHIMGLDNVELITVKLISFDGSILELLKFKSHPDKLKWQGYSNSTGLTHIAFTVKNLEKFYKDNMNKKLIFKAPPHISDDGKAKMTYAEGPEGILIELVEVMKT